jgi:cell division protein FtsX
MTVDEKKEVAKQFAKDYTSIKNIKSVRHNKEYNYFSVSGETSVGKMGQKLTFPAKFIVRVKVNDKGEALFMKI